MKKFATTPTQNQVNLFGIALIVLVSAVWSWQAEFFAPSQDVVIDIPRGTAEQIASGAETSVIPSLINLEEGDSIVLINNDVEGHRVGGLYVGKDSTVTAKFSAVGSFSYLCSVHPSGQTIFEVEERASIMPMAWSLLAMIGLLGSANGLYLGSFSTWESGAMVVMGIGATLGAILVLSGSTSVLAGGSSTVEPDISEKNPIPPSAASIADGKATYLQFCSTCHGESTLGDGPLAPGLDPPPADLVVHVPLHADNVLYQYVQNGIPGTSMPPLGSAISEDETWDLVNYLRTLE